MAKKEKPPKLPPAKGGPTQFYTGFDVYHMQATHSALLNPVVGREDVIAFLGLDPKAKGRWWHAVSDGWPCVVLGLNKVLHKEDADILWLLERIQEDKEKIPGIVVVYHHAEASLFPYLQEQVPGFEWSFIELHQGREEGVLGTPTFEARVVNNTLHIDNFRFSTHLLLPEAKRVVEECQDWRSLVQMILFDLRWDGKVFKPTAYDIPEGDSLVLGKYPLPGHTTNLRLKLVDIRGREWYFTVKNAPLTRSNLGDSR